MPRYSQQEPAKTPKQDLATITLCPWCKDEGAIRLENVCSTGNPVTDHFEQQVPCFHCNRNPDFIVSWHGYHHPEPCECGKARQKGEDENLLLCQECNAKWVQRWRSSPNRVKQQMVAEMTIKMNAAKDRILAMYAGQTESEKKAKAS